MVSSNRLISISSLPKTLTIVGGGVIGLEFATIFSNMGSRVTIIESLDRVLAGMDPEISAEITRQLTTNGVRVLTSHEVLSVENGVVKAENALMDAYTQASTGGVQTIILNFTELDYMNSSGISLLVVLLVRIRRQQQHLLAFGLSEHYRHILELTRLDEVIAIYETEIDALTATQAA